MKSVHIKLIIIVLAFGAGTLYGVLSYIDHREHEIIKQIIVEIEVQQQSLTDTALLTHQNRADEVATEIIRDCSTSSRKRFDTLLGRLLELSQPELVEIDGLFAACANFFSSRKALMVARMEREYEYYRDLVELLATVDDETAVAAYDIDTWKKLVAKEKHRSDIFAERVQLQKQIITALQTGANINTESLQEMMLAAQALNDEVKVVDQQINALRKTLTNV